MNASLVIPWGTIATVATTVGGYLLALVLIARIVDQRKQASATLAWILIIAFLPYVGALLYFFIGRNRVRRRTRKRQRARSAMGQGRASLPHQAPNCKARIAAGEEDSLPMAITRVAGCVADSAQLAGNRAEVFIDTEHSYAQMEKAIVEARHHVHMMSYIFRPDVAGQRFRDLLVAKAKEGVSVRLLVDAVGSHGLKNSFVRPILEAGGQFARFMPVIPFHPTLRPNLRNHRKILVTDGRIGFAGGLNIGDEYRGRKKRFSPWRDTHMRVEGPVVWRLQEVFAEDWFFATGEDLVKPEHFPELPAVGDELVQVVESGPDRSNDVIHAVFFTAITAARKNVFITTPYFIPDPAVLLALKTAAWRGVDVQILVPGRSDLPLIKWAGRSFYRELLAAGVRIFEHRPGMLHAKTMVVDGHWATVGSANMDIRSFRLNFEINLLISGTTVASRLEEIFLADTQSAEELSLLKMAQESRAQKFLESICRVLSPVL